MKTGSTGEAGFCLSATATRNKIHMIAVVMGCESSKARIKDARTLLDYGFSNCQRIHSETTRKESEGFQYKRVRDQKYPARKR